MRAFKRRTWIKSIGALSLGIASPSLSKGKILDISPIITKRKIKTDILVIGGGTAGVIAAILAGREGCDTILVENNSQLGGTTTTGGVTFPGIFHAWGKQIIKGIGWELVSDCVTMNGDEFPDFSIPHGKQHWQHQIHINGPLYAILAEQKCLDAGVKIRYYETPTHIKYQGKQWIVETMGKGILTQITCNQLIDCTGNALPAKLAGFTLLRDTETQPGTLQFRIGDYDFSKLDMSLIQKRYNEKVNKGTLDKIEFRNIESLLKSKGDNVQHIINADSTTSETHSLTNIHGRSSLFRILKFLKTLPGCENIKLMDMQTETAVRETFRIDGLYKITESDYYSGKIFEDAVSYSYYPIDLHDKNGVKPIHLPVDTVATIPLRALIPKNSMNFIVAGRCISSDRNANSALRVQASCMGMGQAAAATAVLANRHSTSPVDVPIDMIKKLIEDHDGIVPN